MLPAGCTGTVPPGPPPASPRPPNLTCPWPCRSSVAKELGKGSREAAGSETGCFGDWSHTRHPGRCSPLRPQPGAPGDAELGDSPLWVCSCLSPAPRPPPGQLCPWGDSDTAGGDTPACPEVVGTFSSQGQVILKAGPVAATHCKRAKPCEVQGHPELGTGLKVLEDVPARPPAPRTHPVGSGPHRDHQPQHPGRTMGAKLTYRRGPASPAPPVGPPPMTCARAKPRSHPPVPVLRGLVVGQET